MIRSPVSRLPCVLKILGACAVAWFFVLAGARLVHAGQASPLIVDADEIIYDESTQVLQAAGHVRLQYRGIRLTADYATFDVAREVLTARGNLVLIAADGRELRGQTLTYDVRLNLAELTKAETLTDRFYIRSDILQRKDSKITAVNPTLTTCPPSRPPAYRITARSIEIIPGQRLIARGASLWLGSLRVLTLPVIMVSLRSPEETARSLPRVGYSSEDGLWIYYQYAYSLQEISGILYTKFGTRSGLIARNILAYRSGPFSAVAVLGRDQDKDLRIFDQAELVLALYRAPVSSLPLQFSASLRDGWFRESRSGVTTTRFFYSMALETPTLVLGPQTTLDWSSAWQDARYGTGAFQSVLSIDTALTHRLTERSRIRLGYVLTRVRGATPFSFDAITPLHYVVLAYARSGRRGSGIDTAFSTGIAYNIQGREVVMGLSYGERYSDRYHWDVSAEYGVDTRTLKLYTDSGLSVGRGTYFTVQTIYNATTRRFEDLDLILKSRLCDCLEVLLKYRQVRQEIWFEVGLTGVPEVKFQYKFPAPPP